MKNTAALSPYIYHRSQKIPRLGIGTWTFGENENNKQTEIRAIQNAIDNYNLTLIDTAEMYADGKSEKVVGEAIKNYKREDLFIIGKILPNNAKQGRYEECCKASLLNLGISYFDVYLLHWRDNINLFDMVLNMEALKSKGLIKNWGVSNFDTEDIKDLLLVPNGYKCFVNQVLYNIRYRGIEYDLIPFCKKHGIAIMAYSPFCNTREMLGISKTDCVLENICLKEDKTLYSLLLGFVIRDNDVFTVFKTTNIEHIKENMKNVYSPLSDESLQHLNGIFPSPSSKVPLHKI